MALALLDLPVELPPGVDDEFGHWLAGFTDGEGCFRIHMGKGGDYYATHYQIKLRSDDRSILEECQQRTGVGSLYDGKARQTDARPNDKPQTLWVAQSRSDCWVIARIFDRYPLRAKKATDFDIWRRALVVWTNQVRGNRWRGQRDWTEMIRLKEELEAARSWKGVMP